MKRAITVIITSLILLLIQSSPAYDLIRISLGAKPDLLLIFLSFIAFRYGSFDGMIYGFVIGLLQDIVSSATFGSYAMIFLNIGFFVGFFNSRIFIKQIAAGIFVTLIGYLIKVIALFLVRMPKNASDIVRSKNSVSDLDNKSVAVSGYTLKEAAKTKYFWMLCLGFTFIGLYVSAYSVQYAAYFQGSLNFDATAIGVTGSIFAVCSLAGNLIGGSLFDKLGALKCLIVAGVLVLISGSFLLLAKNSVIFAHLFSATKGLAVFAYMIGPAYLTGSFFGNKEFGSILGIVQLLFAVGISTGSALFGVLAEKLGYDTSWILVLAAVAIAYALLISATIGMNKLNKEKSEFISQKAA